MSLRGVLGVVGGVIGAIWGGPAGARWGFMIGSTIGSLVDPGTVKGPSIGDIAQQAAQEGGPRPIVFVRSPPITGNVIAQSEPRIEKSKSGGKGGPKVITEQVYRTYAVGVCEGPMGAFRRIWRNNVLVYDASSDPLLTEEENAAFLEKARFFMGTFDQDASPDLEAIFGVGTTPAHRGTVYMVMADEDLTELRGAIPQWIFEVVSASEIVYSTDVLDPWTDDTSDPRYFPGDALLGYSYQYYLGSGSHGSSRDTLTQAVNDGNAASSITVPVDAYNYKIGFTFSQDGLDNAFLKMSPAYGRTIGERVSIYLSYNRYLPVHYEALVIQTGSYLACSAFPEFDPAITAPDSARYWWSSEYQILPNPVGTAFTGAGVWRLDFAANLQTGEYATNNCVNYPGTPQSIVCPDTFIRVARRPHKPYGTWTAVSGAFKCLAVYEDAPGTFVTQYPLNPTIVDGSDDDTEAFWTEAYTEAVDEGTMPGGLVYGVDYPVDISDAWQGQAQAVDGTRPLPDLITDVCERAGLPASLIDVTALPATGVYGFMIINTYAVAEAIRSLGQVYFFDVTSYDGKVRFIPRGRNTVATVTEDDMLEDEQEAADVKRDDSLTVPRVLNLNYQDIAGGLNTDKQTSERAGDRRSVGEASIQTPILLDADQAARAVVINHKVVTENQKGVLNFSLSDRFFRLVPTDTIIVQTDGKSRRMRIEKIERLDGYQTYECAHDRQSAYTSEVEGIPAAPQTAPPSSIVGPTLIVPLDIPNLQDADDAIGLAYYVAVSGLTPAWQGAVVELSYDNGATYIDSRTATTSAVIGELLTALPDHPQEYPDEENSFTWRIDTPNAELEDTDLAGMQNRANLAAVGSPVLGWELINFADAAETSAEGEWEISYLLRGRKDTQTRMHNVGETVVLLQRGLLGFQPASIADLSRVLTFRATSIGAPVTTGTVVSMFYIGNLQRERHPGYLMAHRDGTDVVVSWQGVGRLGGGAQTAQGVRFSGYMLRISDGVDTISTPTNNQTETVDVTTLGAPLTIRVTQTNDLTGEGPAAEVILI